MYLFFVYVCSDMVEELRLLTPAWHPDIRPAFGESHAISSCCYAAVLWHPGDWSTWPNNHRVSTCTYKHAQVFFKVISYWQAINHSWFCLPLSLSFCAKCHHFHVLHMHTYMHVFLMAGRKYLEWLLLVHPLSNIKQLPWSIISTIYCMHIVKASWALTTYTNQT